jgi:hypothetical protein
MQLSDIVKKLLLKNAVTFQRIDEEGRKQGVVLAEQFRQEANQSSLVRDLRNLRS